ncbi:MAG: hypothetical protein LBL86_02190 [Coriobacteriales bacterium]|nr:hypothetical protein [Coriobacteriales bacterium]
MLLKSRSVLVIIALALVAAIAGTVIVLNTGKTATTFPEDGYVFAEPQEGEEGGYTSPQIRFKAGSAYENNFEQDLVFTGEEGQKEALADYGFVHYTSGAISTLKPGVVMSLSNLDNEGFTGYSVTPANVIEKAGNGYAISHFDSSIPFESLVVKLNEGQYLFAGASLEVNQGESETPVPNGFVEVNYIDNGVIEIVSDEQTILTVANDTRLTINDDIVVDLSKREIESGETGLGLSQIVVDGTDNIEVTEVAANEVTGVKLPTFTVIDGTDGSAGSAGTSGTSGTGGADGAEGSSGGGGTAGSAGQAGQVGAPGADGIYGVDGASGADGAGGTGYEDPDDPGTGDDPGDTPTPVKPNIPNYELPVFTLASWDVTAITARGSIALDDQGKVQLDGDPTLTILNTATGQPLTGVTFSPGGDGYIVSTDSLVPGQSYQLIVEGSYTIDGISYNRQFLTKNFIADNIGLSLLYDSATDSEITVNAYKEAYSYAKSVKVSIFDVKTGLEVGSDTVSLDAGDNLVTFYGLNNVEQYRIQMSDLVYETAEGDTITQPVGTAYGDAVVASTVQNLTSIMVATPNFNTDRTASTFTLWPGTTSGLEMNRIQAYRYEYYQGDPSAPGSAQNQLVFDANGVVTGIKPNETAVKVVTSNTRSATITDVSPVAQADRSNLTWNTQYYARVVVEYSDGQYLHDLASPFTSLIQLTGSSMPLIKWMPMYLPGQLVAAEYYDRVVGNIEVTKNGATVEPGQPFTIKFENTEIDHILGIPVNGNPSASADAKMEMSNFDDTTVLKFDIIVNTPKLAQDDPYVISVWGSVDLHDGKGYRLMSLGRIPVNTTESQVLAVAMQELDSAVPGEMFTFNTWMTDVANGADASYEGSNLAKVTYKLYSGYGDPDVDTLLGEYTVNSTTGTQGKPEMSSLPGPYYKGVYTDDLSTLTDPDPAKQTALRTPWQISNSDFSVTNAELANHPVVTVVVDKHEGAVDYTSGLGTSNIFVNKFELQDADPAKQGTAQELKLELTVAQTAPTPPEKGKNALTTVVLTEGTAKNYVPTYAMREGVDPDTVVGFQIRADFAAPELALQVNYYLRQNKLHYTLAGEVDNPVADIQDPLPHSAATSELVAGNVNQIELSPTASDPSDREKITLPVRRNAQNQATIPTLVLMFGKGLDILPGDGGSGDATDTTTFYKYLANDDTSLPSNPTLAELLASEARWRGWTYYATYTALLTLTPPGGVVGDPYLYPFNFDASGWRADSADGTNPENLLYSRRMVARKVAAAFERYASVSDAGSETWKFRLKDPDGVIPESSADKFELTVTSDPEASQPGSPVVGTVEVGIPADETAWESMELRPGAGVDLVADATYKTSYQQSLWNPAITQNMAGLSTEATQEFMPRYHQLVIDDATMKGTGYIGDAGTGNWAIVSDLSRNAVFFTLHSLGDNTTEGLKKFNRVAALKVTTTGSITSTPKTFIVPFVKDTVNNAEEPCVSIGYAALAAAGYIGGEKITCSVEVVFDTGLRGLGLGTGFDAFALQTIGENNVTPNVPGKYYLLNAGGDFLPRGPANAPSGQYYDTANSGFTPGATFRAIGTLAYQSVANSADGLAHNSTRALAASADGPRLGAEYPAFKVLDTVKLSQHATLSEDQFDMETVVPEVRNVTTATGLTDATIRFDVFGGNALDQVDGLLGDTNYSSPENHTGDADYPDLTAGTLGSPTIFTAPDTFTKLTTAGYNGKRWILVNVTKRRTNGTTLDREVDGSPFLLEWVNQPVTNTNSYTLPLANLDQERTYQFTIKGVVTGKGNPGDFSGNTAVDDGGVISPLLTITSRADMYFLDQAIGSTGRRYTFSTSKALGVGTVDNPVRLTYTATDYYTKNLRIDYGITQAGSFLVEYVFTDTTSGLTNGQTYTYTSLKSVQTTSMTDTIPLPLGIDDDINDGDPLTLPNNPFWYYDNHTYTVEVVFRDKGIVGNPELARSAATAFTMRRLNVPQFVVAATPDENSAAVTFAISPIDNDKVVVDGTYMLRLINAAGTDVTSGITIAAGSGAYSGQLLRDAAFTFSDLNKIQTIVLPEASGYPGTPGTDGLLRGTDYFLQLYAVNDIVDSSVPPGTFGNTGALPNVFELYENGGGANPKVDVGDPLFDATFQRTLRVTTLGPDIVSFGDAWTQTAANNTIRVNFEGAKNLGQATQVRYTVYSSNASFTWTTPAPIAFNRQTDNSVSPSMDYVVLMEPNLASKGLYYITMQFYDGSGNAKGEVSTTYRFS